MPPLLRLPPELLLLEPEELPPERDPPLFEPLEPLEPPLDREDEPLLEPPLWTRAGRSPDPLLRLPLVSRDRVLVSRLRLPLPLSRLVPLLVLLPPSLSRG